jgi:hypothetical protein
VGEPGAQHDRPPAPGEEAADRRQARNDYGDNGAQKRKLLIKCPLIRSPQGEDVRWSGGRRKEDLDRDGRCPSTAVAYGLMPG